MNVCICTLLMYLFEKLFLSSRPQTHHDYRNPFMVSSDNNLWQCWWWGCLTALIRLNDVRFPWRFSTGPPGNLACRASSAPERDTRVFGVRWAWILAAAGAVWSGAVPPSWECTSRSMISRSVQQTNRAWDPVAMAGMAWYAPNPVSEWWSSQSLGDTVSEPVAHSRSAAGGAERERRRTVWTAGPAGADPAACGWLLGCPGR